VVGIPKSIEGIPCSCRNNSKLPIYTITVDDNISQVNKMRGQKKYNNGWNNLFYIQEVMVSEIIEYIDTSSRGNVWVLVFHYFVRCQGE
jgi:hypothetical protein